LTSRCCIASSAKPPIETSSRLKHSQELVAPAALLETHKPLANRQPETFLVSATSTAPKEQQSPWTKSSRRYNAMTLQWGFRISLLHVERPCHGQDAQHVASAGDWQYATSKKYIPCRWSDIRPSSKISERYILNFKYTPANCLDFLLSSRASIKSSAALNILSSLSLLIPTVSLSPYHNSLPTPLLITRCSLQRALLASSEPLPRCCLHCLFLRRFLYSFHPRFLGLGVRLVIIFVVARESVAIVV
jgi:hypothetical protein